MVYFILIVALSYFTILFIRIVLTYAFKNKLIGCSFEDVYICVYKRYGKKIKKRSIKE